MITVDARGLPPPEPFERVIDALGRMGRDESVEFIVDREPLPLLRFLARNRYSWETTAHRDGHFVLRIWESASNE